MMLTFEEVRDVLAKAQSEHPDVFEKHVADYLPQTVLRRLAHELLHIFKEHGYDTEEAAEWAAVCMVGFQLGWYVSERAHSENS